MPATERDMWSLCCSKL